MEKMLMMLSVEGN